MGGYALRVPQGDAGARYELGPKDFTEGKVAEARTRLEGLIRESPDFIEAHVSLAAVFYRLKMKAEGDRERVIVQKLNDAVQARQRQEYPAQERKN